MRILILGGNGMLGHAAWQALKKDFNVYVTIRGAFSKIEKFGIFDEKKMFCGVRAEDFQNIEKIVSSIKPDVILNCIGIIKQIREAADPVKSIEINSLFPHKLAALCKGSTCRLIHISTDCVFFGNKGLYTENDSPDSLDLYGRTKLLGEVNDGTALTIRTSIIGSELGTKNGLLEWFLSQNDKSVKGYANVIFSGFTTAGLCLIIKDIIINYKYMKGLYHVSSEPINKYELLMLIKEKMNLAVNIIKDEEFKCDRSLNSSKFRKEAAYDPPSWEDMINKLAAELKGKKK